MRGAATQKKAAENAMHLSRPMGAVKQNEEHFVPASRSTDTQNTAISG